MTLCAMDGSSGFIYLKNKGALCSPQRRDLCTCVRDGGERVGVAVFLLCEFPSNQVVC